MKKGKQEMSTQGGENPNICSEIELQLSCVSGAVASENTLNQLLAVL